MGYVLTKMNMWYLLATFPLECVLSEIFQVFVLAQVFVGYM